MLECSGLRLRLRSVRAGSSDLCSCSESGQLQPIASFTSFVLQIVDVVRPFLLSSLFSRSISRIMGKRVAIVGSGVSGIGALWALKSTDHEVHLYEAGARLGGHTNTVTFEGVNGKKTNVDTGFIVFNTATYRKSRVTT